MARGNLDYMTSHIQPSEADSVDTAAAPIAVQYRLCPPAPAELRLHTGTRHRHSLDGVRAEPACHLEHRHPDRPGREQVSQALDRALAAYARTDHYRDALCPWPSCRVWHYVARVSPRCIAGLLDWRSAGRADLDHRSRSSDRNHAVVAATGLGDKQVLALAAAALFAYAWHAFVNMPAFDSASVVMVRISNVVFAGLARAAVCIAAGRIANTDKSGLGEEKR
jgi:hypothetical protein